MEENRKSLSDLEAVLSQSKMDIEEAKRNFISANEQASEAEAKLAEQNRLLDTALSDRLELEAKVESASDERRSLLERCLGAESELDRSRSTIVELRRKLDDSQAALHELGRENQSIQVGNVVIKLCKMTINCKNRRLRP